MTAFHTRSGEERYGANAMAGDMAEAAVLTVCQNRNRPVVPFGPRRVSTERAQQMTWQKEIRYTPDFLEFGRFIEVQGCGESGKIIFKKEKLEALIFWNGMMPVFFGIFNSSLNEVMFAHLSAILWAVQHPDSTPIVLDEDTKYPKDAWEVPWTLLLGVEFDDAFAAHKVVSA
jgi:hypothetical protein